MEKALNRYSRKRNFEITPEPAGDAVHHRPRKDSDAPVFVVQKHAASQLHYDFRLELEGTLKSWAVPKGPSLDPAVKRLAVQVEDHPLSYASFEGHIPEGQYGAGDVIVWDQGEWEPEGDALEGYRKGRLRFSLRGRKLSGSWSLVRTGGGKKAAKKEQWLLLKKRDDAARSGDGDILKERPESVVSGALLRDDEAVRQSPNRKSPRKRKARSSRPVSIPEQFAPQLATLVTQPPPGHWRYELKFDGYRILARISAGDVRLFTRNGHDWTARFPAQSKALEALALGDSWLDGEAVVLDAKGMPDFQALQNAFRRHRSQDIVYYLFDAPFLDGEDWRNRPLEERRMALEERLQRQPAEAVRYSETLEARDYRDIYSRICDMSLEGVIGKRANSHYTSRRSPDWIKLKCRLRQEFIVLGYTDPGGSRPGFGSLLLGLHEAVGSKEILYAGRVGTGFSQAALKELSTTLRKLERKRSPVAHPEQVPDRRGVHWVQPKLVCEVEFAQWTDEKYVRQATFLSLRSDKQPREITYEPVLPASGLTSPQDQAPPPEASRSKDSGRVNKKAHEQVAGIAISHPDRILDEDSGMRKVELARWYEAIADWIMPELKGRPVALLRAPEGVGGEQFFQKHMQGMAIPSLRKLDPGLDPGHAPLMEINSTRALVGAVQMGCIELHTWGATKDRIERPDRIVLDLDPDPELPWRYMIEATRLLLSVLDDLQLESWLKTSGGKGMHVIVPLARHAGWDTVKAFAKSISEFMTAELPERFTARMGPRNRRGKIFIDYLRNHRGASTVAAYSVRARPGLPVSVPIRRSELEQLSSAAQWTTGNLQQRLRQLSADPWQGYSNRQRLRQSMWRKLGAKSPG
ncbi:DNA ligase D [Kineobactrum salinum]|uniref:DNA ligase (ATP) n=1 Tax=Kineobactrum salinum TaxID=2708301 RepID=A0A6C0TX27_9GAMM|nr:DNA ligase D [Kineobactrum salinum]QIB64188.1 DNA ligase D [Kineobactrum salinum]